MIQNCPIGMYSCKERLDVYQGLEGYKTGEIGGIDSSNCGSWRVEPLGLYTLSEQPWGYMNVYVYHYRCDLTR